MDTMLENLKSDLRYAEQQARDGTLSRAGRALARARAEKLSQKLLAFLVVGESALA